MRKFIGIVLVFVALASVVSPASASATEVVFQPPTTAPVARQFDLPAGPYGPGNRGVDYLTDEGDPITASGSGVVIFAGVVAGSLHLTIDHGSGLLSSYSFVDRILVGRGDHVEAGDAVALSGGEFHFGVRVDGRYVDPEGLFGIRSVRVSLVPRPDSGERAAWLDLASRSEAIKFRDLVRHRSGGGVLGLVGDLRRAVASAAFSPLRWLDPASRLAELFDVVMVLGILASEVRPELLIVRSWKIVVRAAREPECTDGSVEVGPPVERRIAVVVDGLDSSSSAPGSMSKLDLGSHGYEPGDIVRFSYNGGRVDPNRDSDSNGWAAGLPTTTYSGVDTRNSIADNVSDLKALLVDIASANPGVEIDVYGHSLGGLLTRLAVAGVAGSVDVGVAVTFGAPNQGVPLAEIVQAFRLTSPGTVASSAAELIAPDSLLVTEVVDDLSPSGFAGSTSSVAFPAGVRAVSIGGRGDLVVPGSTTRAAGAANVLIGDSVGFGVHGDLPGMAEADREVALVLSGLPPACEGFWNRLIDGGASFGIETVQRAAAVGLVAIVLKTG